VVKMNESEEERSQSFDLPASALDVLADGVTYVLLFLRPLSITSEAILQRCYFLLSCYFWMTLWLRDAHHAGDARKSFKHERLDSVDSMYDMANSKDVLTTIERIVFISS
jgi:hypothetical protein